MGEEFDFSAGVAGDIYSGLALALTPHNAELLLRLSRSEISKALLGLSSFLLLLSIGAFGLITYSRPFRLRHEKKIERDLNRDFPEYSVSESCLAAQDPA